LDTSSSATLWRCRPCQYATCARVGSALGRIETP
jgi:hypothetical protein